MNFKKINFIFIVIILSSFVLYPCFTIVIGKNASSSGNIILAHNEDDGTPPYIFLRYIKGINKKGYYTFKNLEGIDVRVSKKIIPYYWIELKNEYFGDFLSNIYGVSVVSNACQSNSEYNGNGLTYLLRILTIERAKSSRSAVEIAGNFVEKYGYDSSGRTYTFVDKNEAWVFSVIKGKIWIAKRVPDSHVFFIPNYFKIRKVNLKDKDLLYSKYLIKELKKRKVKMKNGVFDFYNVFNGNTKEINEITNLPRDKRAYEVLCGIKSFKEIPFSCKPKSKIGISIIKKLLRDHYKLSPEAIDTERKNINPNKYYRLRPICIDSTRYSLILELGEIPILRLSFSRPDVNPYIPLPLVFEKNIVSLLGEIVKTGDYEKLLSKHFSYSFPDNRKYIERNLFYKAYLLKMKIDKNYLKNLTYIKKSITSLEEELEGELERVYKFKNNNDYKKLLNLYLYFSLEKANEFYMKAEDTINDE